MSDLPDPAPVRTVQWRDVAMLAPGTCFTCSGTRLVKRGTRGVYPITTATGIFDRPLMTVERCPACGAPAPGR